MNFQIIIPTIGGRESYLHWAITSCLDQRGADVSVLVSSNGGAPPVRETVERISDPRIQLVETDRVLPMALHWEFALEHFSGEIATIIGDDDAIMPGALPSVANAFADNRDVLCLTHDPAQYYWPDFPKPALSNLFSANVGEGRLAVRETGPLLKAVSEFRAWYGRLPYLYHGFVHRRALDTVRSRLGGRLFQRIAPDVFSDLALAATQERFLNIDRSLTIGGQGARSTGINFAMNTELGKNFVENVPDAMRPRYAAASLNLILFDCIEVIRRRFAIDTPLDVRWLRLVSAALLEAVRHPPHRGKICADVRSIASERFSPSLRILTSLLTCAVESRLTATPLEWLAEVRANRQLRHYRDARTVCGATNVYDLAAFLALAHAQ